MSATATTRVRAIKQAYNSNPESWGTELNGGALDMLDEAWGYTAKTVSGSVTLTENDFISDESRGFVLHFTSGTGGTVTVPQVAKPYFVINACSGNVTVTPSGGTGAVVRAGTAVFWYCNGTDGFVVDPTLDQIKTAAANVALGGFKLTGVGTGTAATDAATLSNRPEQFATPTGPLAMGSQKITGLAAGTAATDAASLSNRLDQFAAPTASVSFGSQLATNVADPVSAQDAATRAYVLTSIASATVNVPTQTGNAGKFLTTDATTPAWADIIAGTGLVETGTDGSDKTYSLTGQSLAFHNLATSGLVARTGAGTVAARTLAAGSGISISNGDGVSGNPTISAQQSYSAGAAVSLSSDASVDFSLDSTKEQFIFEFQNVVPATDDVDLLILASVDGSLFNQSQTANLLALTTTAVDEQQTGVTTGANLTYAAVGVGSDTNEWGVTGTLKFSQASGSYAHWTFVGFAQASAVLVLPVFSFGFVATTTRVSHLRFQFSSGNLESGRIIPVTLEVS